MRQFFFGKQIGGKDVDISLILKIAGIGMIVAVTSQILSKTGRDEQAIFVSIAGILVALMLLVGEIKSLFDFVTETFGI